MDIGMLWFDSNHGKAVAERVERAANYYEEKYGRAATLCFVHPSTLANPSKLGSMEIQPMDTVLPNHFWLGIKSEPVGKAIPEDLARRLEALETTDSTG